MVQFCLWTWLWWDVCLLSSAPPLPLAPPAAGYSQAAGRAAGPDAGATGGSQQTESSAADEQVCVCVGGGAAAWIVCVCVHAWTCVSLCMCVLCKCVYILLPW